MKKRDQIKLTIDDINNNGEGIVRLGDKRFVLFINDALPGEEVTCEITSIKKNYGTATVINKHTDSPNRINPQCLSYGACGGCQLQHINYQTQLNLKNQTIYDAMKRIAKMPSPEVNACIPSPSQWQYRNKITLPVQTSQNIKLITGYYRKRSNDIVPFQHCPVLLKNLEKNTHILIEELIKGEFYGWDTSKNNVINFIRHIVLREAEFSKSNLSAIIGGRMPRKNEYLKLRQIINSHSQFFNGIQFNKNSSKSNFIWGNHFSTIGGESVMEETLGEFKFQFEISSFFQINSKQAINLYQYASNLIAENAGENVLELYSGVGTLTAFLSKKAKQVTAVEEWPQASKYLNINMRLNDINNVTAFAGKAEDVSESLSHKKYDSVVIDPPRSGCDKRVIASILKIAPNKIVYVSCAPATLARDIKDFSSNGYTMKSIQPFDMFPQTGHVECVVLMTRHKP